MLTILSGKTGTVNSDTFSGGEGRSSIVSLNITQASAATFTLKVAARAIGAGFAGASAFTGYVGFREFNTTGTAIAGSTGITAVGMYMFNLTGLEWRVELVHTAGGAVSCVAALSRGYPNADFGSSGDIQTPNLVTDTGIYLVTDTGSYLVTTP